MPIGPYWYENLGEDDFQKLCQTLVVKEFGTGVRCWPVGQGDGGRDITQQVRTGDVVYQVKWAKNAPKDTVTWLNSAIAGEAEKIKALVAEGAKHYRLLTLVSGTASKAGLDGKGAGTIDKLDEKLGEHRKELGLETLECWWRDDIDARVNLLDTSTLFHFAAMLSGADALRLLAEVQTDAAARNELASLLKRVISAQWTQDYRVKFKQAELDNDSLEALFVDVRATATSPRGPRTSTGSAGTGDGQNDARQVGGAVAYLAQSSFPFTLVRGEPGQGKSTMGQYLAQVYRSEFVTDAAPGARPSISSASSRVPLRIDLRDYASWLNGEDPFADDTGRPPKSPKPRARGDIERFLQLLLADLCVADTVTLTTIHDFLDRFPVALIFDGLDEVAQPPLRRRVVNELEQFIARYQRGAELTPKVIVTTRPNVSDLAEPTNTLFELLVLEKLDDSLRTQYLRKWCEARGIEKRDKRALMKTFNARKAEPHIAQLTGNPMQLTILLYLLHRQGRFVPDRRTQLYDEYMTTSLSREADKTPSVQDNRGELEEVIAYLGWHVQAAAEQENSAGRVRTSQLRSKIFEYLDANQKDTGLVNALFTDATDHVWVLTSKVQGTFEFDVQPVREFFAAKYLDHYATEDKARILVALLSRPFWFNTSRFYAGFATPNEVSGLADGLADALENTHHPLADRIGVWTLLADGVFTQRPRAQARVVGMLLDDLSVRLLRIAGDRTDSLPTIPVDRGATTYAQRLIDTVTADPFRALASDRVAVAASLGVESPPLGQWWLEHATAALGGPAELAWLTLGQPLAAGRLLSENDVDRLTLSSPDTIGAALAAGVVPRSGSTTEQQMIDAVLHGQCSDIVAANTGLVPDLVNAVAPREFLALSKEPGHTPFEMLSEHPDICLAAEKRRDAFRRLARADSRFEQVQAAMNTARRSANSIAAWTISAERLRTIYGPSWLAADIAVIGAAIATDTRRDGAPWNPARQPFGPDIDYSRLANDTRQHRADITWWRTRRDELAATDRALWIYAATAIAAPAVIADLIENIAEDLAELPDSRLSVLMASSSRLGLSGVSRRLPAELVRDAGNSSLPAAILIAHHADTLAGMKSNLTDAFTAPEAVAAARFGASAWPALRAAGTNLYDTASVEWLDVLAAHGPHAIAGVATGPISPEIVELILSSPASYPEQWLRVAEQMRSTSIIEESLSLVGESWFTE